MNAQIQIAEEPGLVIVAVYESPCTPGVSGRWFKDYVSLSDAAWDLERLAILSPSTAHALSAFPAGQTIPVIEDAYVRNPKQTLRGFGPMPFTRAH